MEHVNVDAVLKRAENLCRERGVRLTEQRKVVLRLLVASDTPLTAYELLEQMRRVFRNPLPPMVYRALGFLVEQGLVHKLESIHAYLGCAHPEHFHLSQFLICDACGEVAEVADSGVTKSLAAAGNAAGFRTRHPVVELLGTCSDCFAKTTGE